MECIFILKVAGDGQDLTDNALLPSTSTSLNLFVCSTCLLDTFQPCLFLLLSLFPSSPFSVDSRSLINLTLNLEIFLKDIPESADKVALLIPVYHVLFSGTLASPLQLELLLSSN